MAPRKKATTVPFAQVQLVDNEGQLMTAAPVDLIALDSDWVTIRTPEDNVQWMFNKDKVGAIREIQCPK